MSRINRIFIFSVLSFLFYSPVRAGNPQDGAIINRDAPQSFTQSEDVSKFNRFSLQAVYSTVTFTTDTIDDDTDVSVSANTISQESHGFSTGLPVLYASGTVTTGIGGLNGGTTYYIIKMNENLYKFSTSAVNAAAGTAVDITTAPGGQTFTVSALPWIVGSASFKFQAGNDNTNWSDLDISSVTVSQINTTGNSIWAMGSYGYKYIRLNFTGPTQGAARILIYLNGKRD